MCDLGDLTVNSAHIQHAIRGKALPMRRSGGGRERGEIPSGCGLNKTGPKTRLSLTEQRATSASGGPASS